MQKALDGLVKGFRRYSLSIGVLGLALIIGGTHFVTAQQGGGSSNGNSLGNHHSEITLTVNPTELSYLPIPKQNFPVHVQISMYSKDINGNIGNYGVASFTVANLPENNLYMTYPESITRDRQANHMAACGDLDSLGVKDGFANLLYPSNAGNTVFNCLNDYEHNPSAIGQNLLVFGLANPEAGLANRLFVGAVDPYIDPSTGNPTMDEATFYIQMWY